MDHAKFARLHSACGDCGRQPQSDSDRQELKLEWVALTDASIPAVTVVFTFVGIQLINHAPGFKTPESVIMPNGNSVTVGSRLPWFSTIPFGKRTLAGRPFAQSILGQNRQVTQYFPPSECPVEIHDAYTNTTTGTPVYNDSTRLLTFKFFETRNQGDWTPGLTPLPSVFGNQTLIYPDLPFCKPHLLRVGHKIAMIEQNNSATLQVNSGTVTLRGVRVCEY